MKGLKLVGVFVGACLFKPATGLFEVNGLDERRIPQSYGGDDESKQNRLLGKMGKMTISPPRISDKAKRALDISGRWSGVLYPSPLDWVGVFPCIDSMCSPIGQYPVQFKDTPNMKSSGTVNFTVYVRPGLTEYRLVYVGTTPGTAPYPRAEAVSEKLEVSPDLLKGPFHVRTSVVTASEMRFVWSIAPQYYGNSTVKVGNKSGTYDLQGSVRETYSYSREDLCDPIEMPAASTGWVPPGLQLEATVKGLKPNQKYYYVIESGSGSSEELVFRTGPGATERTKMVIFGDMGQTMDSLDSSKQHSFDFKGRGEISAPNTSALIQHFINQEDGPTLVNHIGDISYATGALALWDSFLQMIEPISNKVPYMTCIGNHEMGYSKSFVSGADSQGECGVVYSALFPFSGQKPQHAEQPWYSFDHGNAHITMMSTEHDFRPGSPQYKWIENDLKSANRDWLLFMGHRPMYISSQWEGDHDIVSVDLQKHIEPLFLQYGVDVAFWGHHHSYQRSCRHVAGSKCVDKNGVQHFVVGTGGFRLSNVGEPSVFEFLDNKTWGVATLDLVSSTRAHFQYHNNLDLSVIDDVWIEKEEKNSFVGVRRKKKNRKKRRTRFKELDAVLDIM